MHMKEFKYVQCSQLFKENLIMYILIENIKIHNKLLNKHM